MLSFRKNKQEGRIGLCPVIQESYNVAWGMVVRQLLHVPVVEVGRTGDLSRVEVVKGCDFDKRKFKKKLNNSLQPTSAINWNPVNSNI